MLNKSVGLKFPDKKNSKTPDCTCYPKAFIHFQLRPDKLYYCIPGYTALFIPEYHIYVVGYSKRPGRPLRMLARQASNKRVTGSYTQNHFPYTRFFSHPQTKSKAFNSAPPTKLNTELDKATNQPTQQQLYKSLPLASHLLFELKLQDVDLMGSHKTWGEGWGMRKRQRDKKKKEIDKRERSNEKSRTTNKKNMNVSLIERKKRKT
ncbi:hypothetical protein DFH27DRAFT_361884 [Peziza echinospora]|nr:hypothetical protein DFH27DRAFT_361884 [Peziza echinospora]